MTTMNNIPQEKWNDLYQAAIKFRELKPWQWMNETQVFSVEHPETGLNCYCCVLGHTDDHYALSVYLGEKGLQSFVDLLTMGTLLEEDPEITTSMAFNETIVTQQFLTCMFVNRDELDDLSYQRIKELGFSFRGANNWIQFRDYAPGLLPWNVEQLWQVDLLTTVLQEATILAKEEKKNSFIPEFKEDQEIPFRISELNEDDETETWVTRVKPLPSYQVDVKPHKCNSVIAEKAKNLAANGQTYEFIGFHGPAPITGQSDRPFFPKILLLTDVQNSAVKFNHVIEEYEADLQAIGEKLLETLVERQEKPSKVTFSSDEHFGLFADLFAKIGIETEMAPASQRANEMYLSLLDSLNKGLQSPDEAVAPMEEEVIVQQPIINLEKIGRNDPCPCGSGKKHKKCCL